MHRKIRKRVIIAAAIMAILLLVLFGGYKLMKMPVKNLYIFKESKII